MLFVSGRSFNEDKSVGCTEVTAAVHSGKEKNRITPKQEDNSQKICYNYFICTLIQGGKICISGTTMK